LTEVVPARDGLAGLVPYPTRRLALLAAIGAVVIIAIDARWAFLAVNAVVFGLFIVDAALAPSPRRILVERSAPEVVALGVAAEITMTNQNPTRPPVRQALAQQLPP
jgi:uncharacterized protein (DUF58 family)